MVSRLTAAALAATLLLAACTPDNAPRAGSDGSTRPPASGEPVAPPTTAAVPTVPLATLPPGAAVCDGYAEVVQVGVLGDSDLRELSGIAASRRHPGVLWAHNDSRDGPRVYALSEAGELLATLELDGAGALDWEDMAVGPGPDPDTGYIYVGDIGDNFSLRSEIVVYRFAEPDIASDGDITDYERFRLRYPEPGRNAEALAVDPATGDLVIVTKDRAGPEVVFVAPAAELRDGLTTRLEEVARLELGGRSEVTAADFSPAGERFALRGYNRVWMWPRTGPGLGTTLAADPCRAASPDEVQGEALAFSADGLSLYTVSEGTGAAINWVGIASES